MSLAVLEKYDRRTATDILAAAALATGHNIEGDEPKLVQKYNSEARELLTEICRQLRISETSIDPDALISISNYLSKQIYQNLFTDKDPKRALADAGQAGRLSPALYTVEQSRAFADLFNHLGVKRTYVESAVRHPDDYQHILDFERQCCGQRQNLHFPERNSYGKAWE